MDSRVNLSKNTFDHPALGFSGQSMAKHRILVLGSIIHQADGGKHDAERWTLHETVKSQNFSNDIRFNSSFQVNIYLRKSLDISNSELNELERVFHSNEQLSISAQKILANS